MNAHIKKVVFSQSKVEQRQVGHCSETKSNEKGRPMPTYDFSKPIWYICMYVHGESAVLSMVAARSCLTTLTLNITFERQDWRCGYATHHELRIPHDSFLMILCRSHFFSVKHCRKHCSSETTS